MYINLSLLKDYQVFNETVNMTIPTTPASAPVLVQTVNGWIVIQQKLDSSFSFNKSWAEFKVKETHKGRSRRAFQAATRGEVFISLKLSISWLINIEDWSRQQNDVKWCSLSTSDLKTNPGNRHHAGLAYTQQIGAPLLTYTS